MPAARRAYSSGSQSGRTTPKGEVTWAESRTETSRVGLAASVTSER